MKNIIFIFLLLVTSITYSQNTTNKVDYGIFERITEEMKNFKIRTSAVPNDELSKKK